MESTIYLLRFDSCVTVGHMPWRQELGVQLMVVREQRRWKPSQAAAAVRDKFGGRFNPGTAQSIERGLNVEIESLEKYAATLGVDLPMKIGLIVGLTPDLTWRARAVAEAF